MAPQTDRKSWLGLLARSGEGVLMGALPADARPAFAWVRAPQVGSVMVRGRTGGTGAPFNLGEMTVTRATLRLEDGTIGHGYVQGRRKGDCEAAALIDALMQTPKADDIRARILAPLAEAEAQARALRARKAAATKVDFFTLVRGENP